MRRQNDIVAYPLELNSVPALGIRIFIRGSLIPEIYDNA